MSKILIVDDDMHLRHLIRTYAELEGYLCQEAECGDTALEKLENTNFDMVILDIMMPGIDGFEVLKRLRKDSRVAVIMLTSRSEEYDKLQGFNLGADDYVSKPFSPKELMARVQAILKRTADPALDNLVFGELNISPGTRRVWTQSKAYTLTPKEFDLLLCLAQNERLVLTREQLLNKVWGYDYYGDIRTVDTHIKSLRERLESHRVLIQTVWGVGYKFEYDT